MSVGEPAPLVGPGSELQLHIDGSTRPHPDAVAGGGPEPSSSSAAAAVIAVELGDAADPQLGLEVGDEAAAFELVVPQARVGVGVREENLFVAGQRLAARAALPATRRQYALIYRTCGDWLRAELGRPPATTDLTADAIGAFARRLEQHGGRGGGPASPTTRRVYLNMIRALVRDLGLTEEADRVRVPRHRAGPPETLTDTDYANLLRVPDRRSITGKREVALLRVLGVRSGHRRLRGHLHGRRRPAGPHPHRAFGDLPGRPDRRPRHGLGVVRARRRRRGRGLDARAASRADGSGRRAMIEVRITKRIHDGLTLNVSMAFGPERVVVFGPSGAGKTTLLRLIAGLDRPDSGRVAVGGATWFDSAARIDLALRRRGVGMIFQDDLLFPHLSVAANIRFGLGGVERKAADRRVAEVADLCGVSALLARRPETLSGGERQRAGLARALAPRPKLLLCDEPVSAIDLDGRFALIERIRRAQEAEGVPLLFVTHSPSEAVAIGDVMVRLVAGEIVDRGVPLDVLARGAGAARLDDVRNLLRGVIAGHSESGGETIVALDGGPRLVVPRVDRAEGACVVVSVRADDVLLARGPIVGLSARNVIAGTVSRMVSHGGDVEVVARTGEVEWIASVTGAAVAALDLRAGAEVHLIVKARGCHVL